MRWCFLCSTEFPEGTPMKMARGGTNICLSCAETERGQSQLVDSLGTEGYRANQSAVPRYARARNYWLRKGTALK